MSTAIVLSSDDMTLVRELLTEQERTLRLAAGITSITTRAVLYGLSADRCHALLGRLEFAQRGPFTLTPAAAEVAP